MSVLRLKEGLSAIAAEVLEDIRKQAEAAILNAEAEAKEILKKSKEEAEKAYAEIIAEARTRAEAEKQRIKSLTAVEVRNHLLQIKEALVDQAFQKALEKLGDFAETADYHVYLLRFIEEASKRVESEKLIVYVNKRDRAWLEKNELLDLSSKLNVDLQLADVTENCMGGCKVRSGDGKVVFDNTIENRLQQFKAELRLQVACILFRMGEPENDS